MIMGEMECQDCYDIFEIELDSDDKFEPDVNCITCGSHNVLLISEYKSEE